MIKCRVYKLLQKILCKRCAGLFLLMCSHAFFRGSQAKSQGAHYFYRRQQRCFQHVMRVYLTRPYFSTG